MNVSISTGFSYKRPYEEILDVIAAAGATHVELMFNQSFCDVPLADLARALRARDLAVSSLHTALEFFAFQKRQNEKYWLERSREASRELGAGLVVTHMVWGKDFEVGEASLDEKHKKNLIDARKSGDALVVTTENLPTQASESFLANDDALEEFLQEHGIGLTFDTTHYATHGRDIVSGWGRFRPYVRNIHLSDFGQGAEHKILGTGELPLRTFLNGLRRDRYDGPLTIELDFDNPTRNRVGTFDEAVAGLRTSLDFVRDCL